MAEQIDIGNGTPQRVAFDLWRAHLHYLGDNPTLEQSLALFAECLKAARSHGYDIKKLT